MSLSDKNADKSQPGRGGWDYWVVKVDSAGTKQWDKTFGGSGDDELRTLCITTDGGYLLGGRSLSGLDGDKTDSSRGGVDYWIVKINSKGILQWDKTFGGSDFDALEWLQQTADGGYILGGLSYSSVSGDKSENSRGDADYWVIKTDDKGNKQWDKTYGGSDFEYFTAVQQTTDGGYILGGYSYSGKSGDKTGNNRGQLSGDDYWVVKLKGDGTKQWDKTIGGNDYDELQALQQTADGGYILGGFSESGISGDKTGSNKGDTDFWIVKLNENGGKLWDKTLGGDSFDRLYALQQTDDGGFILGGSSQSGATGHKTQPSQGWDDYWVVKVDSAGNKLWDQRYGGAAFDFLYSLQQTTDGGYLLGGYTGSKIGGDITQTKRGQDDYWIVKLACPAAAIAAINTLQPATEKLMLFPNPAYGPVTIYYHSASKGMAVVKLYDLLGKIVLQKTMTAVAGNNQWLLQAAGLHQGMYIVEVSVGTATKRAKLMVRK